MKRLLSLGLVLLLASALAGAAPRARYRIQLRDGRQVFSTDLPVQQGTVVIFHQAPGGVLTGIPAEEIVAVRTGSSQVSARPQVADSLVRDRMTAIQILARPLQPGEIVVLGPTGSGSAAVAGRDGYGAPGSAMTGDDSASGANVGNGAYGATSPGAPGSGQPAIAPNGTPATGQPGTPASAQPNTAPSGTPASPPPGSKQ
jgi:hypothetical protein